MFIRQGILAIFGLSSGLIVAAGLFSFIVSLGVVSDFADRTKTGKYILLYEDAIVVGGILGNLFFIYQLSIPASAILLGLFGLFAGMFAGCWAMALAEVLNVFPIFIRRIKLLQYIPYLILGIAIGKGIGAIYFFYVRW